MTERLPGYTTHGHAIEGLIQVGKPEKVARCGGPGLCTICSRQAANALEEANMLQKPAKTSHVLMVYRYKNSPPGTPWHVFLVSDSDSAMSDGETYDLVKYYESAGHWEVHTQPIDLPE